MKYTEEEIRSVMHTQCYLPSESKEDVEATERYTAIAEKILDSGKTLNIPQAWKELRKEGWRANKGKP